MQWNSLEDFFHMGGYGLYVWGSFGICTLAMIIEPWILNSRSQKIKRQVKRLGGQP
ncbi:MAG: heme exporter protein CcmD [Ferrovum sp. 37-45-19]|uniref:heme exporter protein CcmD n=1 Tax=Ferrovum sp. JA12 TaxID=1356299 RepID=UPI000714631F|nr:heme exporter protein D (CcmD) [Ferrovum sp. JA12]OYV79759.1 MAG: heme exporter protein CcmD [Ferrovum sp. 21-44-67]OYV95381.1 MAG: heme exporter protein CcmD [Ferrovum sp. 37-45-19]OZB31440.1 MAG: heme exporter protein CcmD [Ferrovum sp. 34-44-207]